MLKKKYFSELNSQRAGKACYWHFGARAALKYTGAESGLLGKQNQEPEPLGKKSGTNAAKKLAGSSALPKTTLNNQF